MIRLHTTRERSVGEHDAIGMRPAMNEAVDAFDFCPVVSREPEVYGMVVMARVLLSLGIIDDIAAAEFIVAFVSMIFTYQNCADARADEFAALPEKSTPSSRRI